MPGDVSQPSAGDPAVAAHSNSTLRPRILGITSNYARTTIAIGIIVSYAALFAFSTQIPNALPVDSVAAPFYWFILNTLVISALSIAVHGVTTFDRAHPLIFVLDIGFVVPATYVIPATYVFSCLALLAITGDAEVIFMACYFILPIIVAFIGVLLILLTPSEDERRQRPATRENRKTRREAEKSAAKQPGDRVGVTRLRSGQSSKQDRKELVKHIRDKMDKRGSEGNINDELGEGLV
ncbi:hypothetical protein BDV96DRAFT_641985 [Lophiotrema nucula]|uniref:Uncharacterized protein n=1 Tax=Lophiotrema nucula TaxID=690887 RepID=A0A6A5ZMP1_9PLEO|nr:hypothetical protein BDV96DRAFT_641985 [Lophiotrema nucula]